MTSHTPDTPRTSSPSPHGLHYHVRPPMPFTTLGFHPCTIREDSTIHFLWGYLLLEDSHITDVLVTHFSHDFRDFADLMEQHGHELD